ncbi:MAG: hypothetical protein ACJ75B_13005 [Flavisolibacter sp.]
MPTEEIPIVFNYKGRQYNGYFRAPHGAGGKVRQVYISKRYCDQLILTGATAAGRSITSNDLARTLAYTLGN